MNHNHIHYFTTSMAIFALAFGLLSCSYTISMAHTEGTATDTIDDTSSNTPDLNATIPLTPGV